LTRSFNIHQEETMSLSRKLTIHVLFALLLFVGVSPAAAAPAAGHEVVTSTASFFIPADQCPLLPAGVGVEGSGESVAVTNTRTLADGSMVIRINNLIKGDAIDSNGDAHKFVYHNSSTETILPSGLHIISMNDIFTLSGPGPHYSVGFNWRWTFTPPEAFFPPPAHDFEPLHGDLDTVLACDPL
jgi:hypothetical protein